MPLSLPRLLAIARDPGTPGDRLQAVYEAALGLPEAGTRQVHGAVAGNPNLSPELLILLVKDHPREILDNPAFEMINLEDPAWPERLPQWSWLGPLLREPAAPEALCRLAWGQGRSNLIPHLLANPCLPADLVAGIALHLVDGGGLGRAVSHPNMPPRLRSILEAMGVKEGSPWERWQEEAAIGLDDALHLAGQGAAGRRLAALLPALPLERIGRWVADEDPFVRGAMARRMDLPPAAIERLGGDAEVQVRQVVAAHPALPPRVASRLAEDADRLVRAAVAANRRCPPAVVEQLCGDPAPEVQVALAARPDLSPEALTRLSGSAEPAVRLRVGRHHSTPPAVLEVLAGDSDPELLEALVRHPSTPEDARAALVPRLHPVLREELAADVSTRAGILVALAEDLLPRVRLILAENPLCPAEALRVLEGDPVAAVREVALRPRLSRRRER